MNFIKSDNPFQIGFGRIPSHSTSITRELFVKPIVDDLNSNYPSIAVRGITGARGSGKTVVLREIANQLNQTNQWFTINLNNQTNLLEDFISQLYEIPELYVLFREAKLNLSLLGIDLNIEDAPPITTLSGAARKMLSQVKKLDKRVLVTIDEVSNTASMKDFVSHFQMFMTEDYPIFLIMSGLYDNFKSLQNEKDLTFLQRAPKEPITKLDQALIVHSYSNIFKIPTPKAIELAKMTSGYSFGFQLLGYLLWDKLSDNPDLLDTTNSLKDILYSDYYTHLIEYAYEKIYSELSLKDIDVLVALSELGGHNIKVVDIRNRINMTSNTMSTYRQRLEKGGLILTSHYGHFSLALPYFSDYVLSMVS